jgi:hypothetical protein
MAIVLAAIASLESAPSALGAATPVITRPADNSYEPTSIVSIGFTPCDLDTGHYAELYRGATIVTSGPTWFGSLEDNIGPAADGDAFSYTIRQECDGTVVSSGAVTVRADRAAPTGMAITSPAAGTVVSTGAAIAWSGSDASGVREARLSVDGAAHDTTFGNPPAFPAFAAGGFADGTHQLTVVGVDGGGRASSASAPVEIVVDRTAPSLAFTSGPAEGATVRPGSVAVGFSASDVHGPVVVTCSLDGGPFTDCSQFDGANGSFTTAALGDGTHTVTVRGADHPSDAPNVGTITRTVRVDGTAPKVAITEGPADGVTVPLSGATYGFTVDDATATVECSVALAGASPNFGPCSGPGLRHDTGPRAAAGWIFTVRATDPFGNAASASRTLIAAATPTGPEGAAATPTGPAGGSSIPAAAGAVVLDPKVNSFWSVRHGVTRPLRLFVTGVPAGAKVTVRCLGRRCAFKTRRVPVHGGRADVRRALRTAAFHVGQTLEVRITKPGTTGKVVRYVFRPVEVPAPSHLCLPDGAQKPARCR